MCEDIKEVIDKILKEPIAKHMLDSGGAYGYLFEKNQSEGYLQGLVPVEEYTDEELKERTLDVTIPVYDFLTYNLERDEDAIAKEQQIMKKLEKLDINPYHIFEVEEIIKEKFQEGMMPIDYINTYNFEEYISQTIQFCPFMSDDEDYIILQVHNGCDVRGGYTEPKVFKVKDMMYFISGLNDRRCECDCGLNDYWIFGSDDATDGGGSYVLPDEIYKRTYVDDDGLVRCVDCDSVVKGGFVEW